MSSCELPRCLVFDDMFFHGKPVSLCFSEVLSSRFLTLVETNCAGILLSKWQLIFLDKNVLGKGFVSAAVLYELVTAPLFEEPMM